MTTTDIDESKAEAFAGQLLDWYARGMLGLMVDLGHRTGLFDALATGPATTEELAARAGRQERYVREWLGAMTAGDVVTYDPATGTYALPPEHALCLSGPGVANLAAIAQINTLLAKHVGGVADAFTDGGGVSYAEFRPEFTDVMDAASRGNFDELLVDQWLPVVPGLTERLAAGVRAADIGCGTGHAAVVLAKAFPASQFVGFDIATDAIARATAEAASEGLTNARFEVQDAASLADGEPFDVVFTFDSIHDQVDPAGALAHIHAALAPGGTYFMLEPTASSQVEDNAGNPFAAWMYGVSTLHCMTVSLAHGGAGFGAMWGHQRARALLAETGFTDIAVTEAPGDPLDTIFASVRG